ncbi:MAG: adenylyltransferase/cytidyltransferase family protein [Desulfobacterales bacterium]|nr:adenylyltransferase/cytidyltransferase family protein [Desulfobacterales bacterium]
MGKIVIVSGYFNPIHVGHIRLLEEAKKLGDQLIVIVNNDKQQRMKKGKIIMPEKEREEVVRAIRWVDDALISVDEDKTVIKSIEKLAKDHPGARILFANGGDRESSKVVPETAICEKYGIEMRFDVGGISKLNSSTNINVRRGVE